ncbi:MAG: fused MFS/spermidine synthase [Eubacterium sp.]|nr:fused MFS/spermidine synthase [Eubacterium sp.]
MSKEKAMKNKTFLYLTEFFSGMAVMAVELGASRLLAPYFSSSQIVWTIIISTIMIAMALGNIFGGRSADKNPNPDRLYRRLLIAAVWIAAIPVLGKYIIIAITGILIVTVSSNLLTIAAFLACMIIFVAPCFLLGTVTPSLVKYTVGSLDDNGRTVGTLGAANTIGSIIGTFLPTFVTIPAVGTSVTFLIFSGVILALALIYFLSARVNLIRCLIAVILFIVCIICGNSDSFAFWENNLAYEGESIYNYLQVKEQEDSTILSTNVLFGVQSITKKTDGLTGMYYDTAMAAPVMSGALADGCDILILGNGSGTYARQCERYFDNVTIEGVEIDGKITELANEYFDAAENVPVTTYDGRAYLQAVDKQYDVIMVDAYQDITIPFQMSSQEFFALVRDHLKENGVMVVNMNMRTTAENSINDYLEDTIASVFPYVETVDVAGYTNRELFASRRDPSDSLRDNEASVKKDDLRTLLTDMDGLFVTYEGGDRILTDDHAPVELLGMRALDEIINNELGYYKDLFKEKGLKGLLEEAI